LEINQDKVNQEQRAGLDPSPLQQCWRVALLEGRFGILLQVAGILKEINNLIKKEMETKCE